MNRHQLPRLETLHNQESRMPYLEPQIAWYASRRLRIFVASFLLFGLIGLGYVFQQPAIYQSKIVLVTVAPVPIDQDGKKANIQHSAIQGNILTGQKLIEATRKALSKLLLMEIPSSPVIHNMLFFSPVAETNLVELRAEGGDAKFLPVLLNTLTEQYEQYRREQIEIETTETSSALNDQFNTLTMKVEQKRDELDRFRGEHDILSVGRNENYVLTRLKGLTDSLNKAYEAEVKAIAVLKATRTAINKGQSIVPDSDQRTLANLEQRAQQLRERLRELDRRYTRAYLERKPNLKVIPEQLAALEEKIATVKGRGRGIALAQAERNSYAAQQTLKELRQQVKDYKETATEFTRRFAEQEALVKELSQLEHLYRQTQNRLINIEVKQREKYPQVTVVEPAYEPIRAIRPDYFRDSGIALLLSFFLGIATIWLFEFLKREPKTEPAGVASWSRIYSGDRGVSAISYNSPNQLDYGQQLVIDSQAGTELGVNDIEKLFAATNKQGQTVIAGLLSGLTIDEITALSPDQIDMEGLQLNILGVNSRTIRLSPGLAKQLANFEEKPTEKGQVESLVVCAAFDSGLPDPTEINSDLIRHTYVAYLVRQGLRLSDLEEIIGAVPAEELAGYAVYLPIETRKAVNEITLVYPVLSQ